MTFTELEYILMMAVAVMLWRNAVITGQRKKAESRADRYAGYLLAWYFKKGKVVRSPKGGFEFVNTNPELGDKTDSTNGPL